jgi:hypothetical protein
VVNAGNNSVGPGTRLGVSAGGQFGTVAFVKCCWWWVSPAHLQKDLCFATKTAKDSQRALSEKLAHLMLSLADRAKPWLSLDWVSRVLDQ